MQIAPSELRDMSLWEFAAMVKGWNQAHEPAKSGSELTPEIEDELEAYINEPPIWMN
jgi:hypothetical protein